MARRSDHNREELKEIALQAGLEIVNKQGLSGLSARKIATKIGYTAGTLYNIFSGLDDLIIQVNYVTLKELKKALVLPDDKLKADAETNLVDIGKNYIDFANRHFNAWNALFLHQTQDFDKLPEANHQIILDLHNHLVKTISQIAPFKKADVELNAKILWSSIHGICMLGITQTLDLIEQQDLHNMAEVLVRNQVAAMKLKL